MFSLSEMVASTLAYYQELVRVAATSESVEGDWCQPMRNGLTRCGADGRWQVRTNARESRAVSTKPSWKSSASLCLSATFCMCSPPGFDVVVLVSADEPQLIDFAQSRCAALAKARGATLGCVVEDVPRGTIGGLACSRDGQTHCS